MAANAPPVKVVLDRGPWPQSALSNICHQSPRAWTQPWHVQLMPFEQAVMRPRWQDSTHLQKSSSHRQQMCPLGHKQIKRVSLPSRPFGFSFTALQHSVKWIERSPIRGLCPTLTPPPAVSCWEPLVGMFTVWRVNSLIPSGMFPLGGAVSVFSQTTNLLSPPPLSPASSPY